MDIASALDYYINVGQFPPRCAATTSPRPALPALLPCPPSLLCSPASLCLPVCSPACLSVCACPGCLQPASQPAVKVFTWRQQDGLVPSQAAHNNNPPLPASCTCPFDPCSKINLGIGAYGRSWTLANKANTAVGAPAYAAGAAGKCTGELSACEQPQEPNAPAPTIINLGCATRLGL